MSSSILLRFLILHSQLHHLLLQDARIRRQGLLSHSSSHSSKESHVVVHPPPLPHGFHLLSPPPHVFPGRLPVPNSAIRRRDVIIPTLLLSSTATTLLRK